MSWLHNHHMRNWLEALWAETAFSAWWILSALSTLSTFFFPALSGKWRLVSAMSAAIGFAWANYRVFQKQEHRISVLSGSVASHEGRASQLRIKPDRASRYILIPVADHLHSDFNGGYFEFCLMVENVGRKNSTVDRYDVEIVELRSTFRVTPDEGRTGLRGRHCQHGMQPNRILSKTGILRINAESTTDRGTLLFFIPGLSLDLFANSGLKMHGDQRRFDPLHCRLTLTDTTDSTATADFELSED